MKYLLILSVFFVSCEKTRCYTCQTKSKPASLWMNEPFVDGPTSQHCDWTDEDKAAYVKANSYRTNPTYGYGAVKITNCW